MAETQPGEASRQSDETEWPPAPVEPPKTLSVAELLEGDFQAPIRDLDQVNQTDLRTAYAKALAQAKAAGDEEAASIYALMESVCGMRLHPDERGDVWVALASGPGWSTATPSLFAGEQSEQFASLLSSVAHPGLLARLADLVWTNDRRRGGAAATAAEAYRLCVEGLLSGAYKPWREMAEDVPAEAAFNLHRLLQIVHASTKKSKRPSWLTEIYMAVYDRALHDQAFVPFVTIADLGLHYELITRASVARDAEQLAVHAAPASYPEAVRRSWSLAARLYGQTGDQEARRRCQLGALECTLAMRSQVHGAAAEAAWVADALQELRHISGMEAKQAELGLELRRLQKLSLEQMGSIPLAMDVDEERETIVALFSRLNLSDGLKAFVQLEASPDPNVLKMQALETARAAPLMAMIPVNYIDGDGRTVSRSPGATLDDDPEAAWFDAMIERGESVRRSFCVAGQIDPARAILQSRFGIEERHVEALVRYSPFVPLSQKPLLTLGFTRFFQGDFMSAAHLVIPQVEACLRHLLKVNGHEPSKRRDDSTEEDLSLSGLFARLRPELDRILSVAIADEVDRVFSRRPGPALRHELAHGQLSAGACFHSDVYYAVWFVLSLTGRYLLNQWDGTIAAALRQIQGEAATGDDVLEEGPRSGVAGGIG